MYLKIPDAAHKPPAPPKPPKKTQNTASKIQASVAVEAQKRAAAAFKRAEKKAAMKEKVLSNAISELEKKKKLSRDAAIKKFSFELRTFLKL